MLLFILSVSSLDYVSTTQVVTLGAGVDAMCIDLEINDDDLVEETERLLVYVASTQGSIRPLVGGVDIRDNDSM